MRSSYKNVRNPAKAQWHHLHHRLTPSAVWVQHSTWQVFVQNVKTAPWFATNTSTTTPYWFSLNLIKFVHGLVGLCKTHLYNIDLHLRRCNSIQYLSHCAVQPITQLYEWHLKNGTGTTWDILEKSRSQCPGPPPSLHAKWRARGFSMSDYNESKAWHQWQANGSVVRLQKIRFVEYPSVPTTCGGQSSDSSLCSCLSDYLWLSQGLSEWTLSFPAQNVCSYSSRIPLHQLFPTKQPFVTLMSPDLAKTFT